MVLYCCFNLHSPDYQWGWTFFSYVYELYGFPLMRNASSFPLLISLLDYLTFFMLICANLYIFCLCVFLVMHTEIISQIVAYLLTLFMISPVLDKIFILRLWAFSIFSFMVCAFCLMFKKLVLTPKPFYNISISFKFYISIFISFNEIYFHVWCEVKI